MEIARRRFRIVLWITVCLWIGGCVLGFGEPLIGGKEFITHLSSQQEFYNQTASEEFKVKVNNDVTGYYLDQFKKLLWLVIIPISTLVLAFFTMNLWFKKTLENLVVIFKKGYEQYKKK